MPKFTRPSLALLPAAEAAVNDLLVTTTDRLFRLDPLGQKAGKVVLTEVLELTGKQEPDWLSLGGFSLSSDQDTRYRGVGMASALPQTGIRWACQPAL